MLHVKRLKKSPSVAPKKKRVVSLRLFRLLHLLLLPPLHLCKLHRQQRLRQLLQPMHASVMNSAVRTNHVLTTTIVAVAAVMASAKTLRIVLLLKKKRLLHALLLALPKKKAMASVAVVVARAS